MARGGLGDARQQRRAIVVSRYRFAAAAKTPLQHPWPGRLRQKIQNLRIVGALRAQRQAKPRKKTLQGVEFVAKNLKMARRRSNKIESHETRASAKRKIFRQETPSGQNGLATLGVRRFENIVGVRIRVARKSRKNHAIGFFERQPRRLVARRNQHGLYLKRMTGIDETRRAVCTVGNENSMVHGTPALEWKRANCACIEKPAQRPECVYPFFDGETSVPIVILMRCVGNKFPHTSPILVPLLQG